MCRSRNASWFAYVLPAIGGATILTAPAIVSADSESSIPSRVATGHGGLPPSILLVRTNDDSEVIRRLRAELGGSGWRIIEMSGDGSELETERLALLASEHAAMAAVRVRARIGQIDIYVGHAWGNIEETLRSEGDVASAQILALRTTEALRAHGLSIGQELSDAASTESSPTRPDGNGQHPSTGVVPLRSPEPNRISGNAVAGDVGLDVRTEHGLEFRGLWLEMAPALLTSPGRLGTSIAGWFGLRLALSSRWSWAGFGTFPFSSMYVSDPEGQANVSTYLLGTSVEANWLNKALVSGTAGLGVSALFTRMNGRANLGYAGSNDTVVTAAPVVYLTLRSAMTPSWNLFATALTGTSVPEVSLKFDERIVASWGQPFILLKLGLDVRCLAW